MFISWNVPSIQCILPPGAQPLNYYPLMKTMGIPRVILSGSFKRVSSALHHGTGFDQIVGQPGLKMRRKGMAFKQMKEAG